MEAPISPDMPTAEQVRDALTTVIDPELGLNLVDLGLIYSIDIVARKVAVTMTLTTRGCPMHESLIGGVRHAVLGLETVREVDVRLVWDPPWHPSMMSEEAQEHLGVTGGRP